MNKRIIANRFGLVALMSLSLFASTAYAGNTPAPSPVVVTNTPAQPIPMVGLTEDSDAPARKPFQWTGYINAPSSSTASFKVTTVPANQRLVIEQVSGMCSNFSGYITLNAYQYQPAVNDWQYLPANFVSGNAYSPASTPVRFYLNPGADFDFHISNGSPFAGNCYLTVSGYYVNLP
jgi:hypothetical protein